MKDLFKVFEQKKKNFFSIILKFKDKKCNVFYSLGMKQTNFIQTLGTKKKKKKF